MERLAQEGRPVLGDLKQRMREMDYPFFPVLRELSLQESLVAELRAGGRVIGTLWLNALEHGNFRPRHFEIFQILADQVAAAVANILPRRCQAFSKRTAFDVSTPCASPMASCSFGQ